MGIEESKYWKNSRFSVDKPNIPIILDLQKKELCRYGLHPSSYTDRYTRDIEVRT